MEYQRMIIMSSNNQARNKNKNKHFSVDNGDYQDSKEEEQQESTRATTIDITNVGGDTSKDILDISETPDVATWNKGTQIKGTAADIIKKSQGRGEGIEAIDKGKITPTNTYTSGLRQKASEDLDIDPANKGDVAKVINSGESLTDMAEDPFSRSGNNSLNNQKKSQKAK
jgi:hypothetical protein